MSAVEELMKDVAAAQRNDLRRKDLLPEVQHLVAARMLEGTAHARAESRTWRWLALGTAAAATAAVLLVVTSLQRAPFLTFIVDSPDHFGQTGDLLSPPPGQAMAAVFSDGSRVIVGDRSNARIDAVDANGATMILDDGHLEASIIHRPQTRWEVRAGDYRIRVTGTRFSAAWNRREKALTVRLYEGSVEVTGPGVPATGAKVRAGHVLHATARGATLAMAESATPQPAGLADPAPADPATQPVVVPLEPLEPSGPPTAGMTTAAPAPSAEVAAAAEPAPTLAPTPTPAPASAWAHARHSASSSTTAHAAAAPAARTARAMATTSMAPTAGTMTTTASSSWRSLARHARYREALTLAIADGFDAQCEQLRGDDLVLLADVARLGGDLQRADQAYRAALRRFPALDRPAFALGVMSFEARHDYRDAASWLTRYLQQHPNGPLATEASGRLLEAWDLAGEVTRAREAARSYLRDHPTGPHRALARRLAAP